MAKFKALTGSAVKGLTCDRNTVNDKTAKLIQRDTVHHASNVGNGHAVQTKLNSLFDSVLRTF